MNEKTLYERLGGYDGNAILLLIHLIYLNISL